MLDFEQLIEILQHYFPKEGVEWDKFRREEIGILQRFLAEACFEAPDIQLDGDEQYIIHTGTYLA